jgi:kumamolisin
MSSEPNYVKLLGSESKQDAVAVREGSVPADELVRFQVLVRRRKLTDEAANAILAPLASDRRRHLTRDEFRDYFGSDPAELEKVVEVLRHYSLQAVETDVAKRAVSFTGTAKAIRKAFGVELVRYSVPGKPAYRTYEGALLIPAAIADLVEGVVGLDGTPRMNPHFRQIPEPPRLGPHFLTPVQVAHVYKFPPFTSGVGQISDS